MKINNTALVKRWDNLMESIGLEYLTINNPTYSVLESEKHYYNVEHGIDTDWMKKEAEYFLSCYYEPGHCRCDDRFEGKESYKIWKSETGRLKRLISTLEKMDYQLIVEWEN